MSGYKVTCPRDMCARHRDCWIASGREPLGADERDEFLSRWAEDVQEFLDRGHKE